MYCFLNRSYFLPLSICIKTVEHKLKYGICNFKWNYLCIIIWFSNTECVIPVFPNHINIHDCLFYLKCNMSVCCCSDHLEFFKTVTVRFKSRLWISNRQKVIGWNKQLLFKLLFCCILFVLPLEHSVLGIQRREKATHTHTHKLKVIAGWYNRYERETWILLEFWNLNQES